MCARKIDACGKNLPPSWRCKTITGLFASQRKGFFWYVLHRGCLPSPRSVGLVSSGEVKVFSPVREWENNDYPVWLGKPNTEKISRAGVKSFVIGLT